ncbi:hypothetical protein L210DRAFT_3649784 [Boletus edulis BED1]|uniref:Secreted protein n=1 Tax=Boletus edulis BED1 TaxID=1328754 RepID=A0AAD4GAR2_BOLED|nr:hypothetical protein L210DRAFT_3649784 [Boletus edulis BED1]
MSKKVFFFPLFFPICWGKADQCFVNVIVSASCSINPRLDCLDGTLCSDVCTLSTEIAIFVFEDTGFGTEIGPKLSSQGNKPSWEGSMSFNNRKEKVL